MTTPVDPHVTSVTEMLLDRLKSAPALAVSVAKLVETAAALVRDLPGVPWESKRALLIKAMETVAAGGDGVLGTTDDLISPEVMGKLRLVLENRILDEVLDLVVVFRASGAWSGLLSCLKGSPAK